MSVYKGKSTSNLEQFVKADTMRNQILWAIVCTGCFLIYFGICLCVVGIEPGFEPVSPHVTAIGVIVIISGILLVWKGVKQLNTLTGSLAKD